MSERELSDRMADAARRATEQCIAKGYGRHDHVTRESARRAAEDVYLAERGAYQDHRPPVVAEDPWKDRSDIT